MPVQRPSVLLSAVLTLALVMLTPGRILSAQEEAPEGGGFTTQAICNPSPCPPKPSISKVTQPPGTVAPDAGPFTYVVDVVNLGQVAGYFYIQCGASTTQLPCATASPAQFSIAAGAKQKVTVGFSSRGLGRHLHWVAAVADWGGPPDTVFTYITVSGPSFISHAHPLPNGELATGDTLKARYSHPSGINKPTFKLLLNGQDSTNLGTRVTVGDTTLTARSLGLAVGTHKWTTYGCALNGRCDSVTSSFSALTAPPLWALDDSLPPPKTESSFSLLPGALPLPVDSLRGCPRVAGDPEIRLSGPFSFGDQASQNPALDGFIFMASMIWDDTLRISALTVDRPNVSSSPKCSDFTYLNDWQYDWDFWDHSSPDDPLWDGYPYGDRVGGGQGGGSGSTTPTVPPHIIAPGPIAPNSYWVKLNGTLIVSGGLTQRPGMVKSSLTTGGSLFKLPVSDALVRRYDFNHPTANSGGWNEIVASIADSTGRRTNVRARFVVIGAPPKRPLALTALRDFSRLDQGECAAFGAFQCGGVVVTQRIPGFTTRDKDRGLHLIYRSASQRYRVPLLFRWNLSRYQATPDSLRVNLFRDGVMLPDPAGQRYAGKVGPTFGPGTVKLQPRTNEIRVLAGELWAQDGWADSIRPITARVRSYYSGPSSTQDDLVSQDVVQLQLSDTTTTRFGRGWQLAELHRLLLGQPYQGAPAAVWISGDGSYSVFRKVCSAWLPPEGQAVRLADSLVTAGLKARYVLFLENGASVGFNGAGLQKYTADMIGNETTFSYAGTTSRLERITDPSGIYYELQYNVPAAPGQVTDIFIRAPGQTAARVASLEYDAGGKTLMELKVWRSATTADSTRFTYKSGSTFGALLETVTDPRSTAARPVVTTFTYDAIGTPTSQQRPPDRSGVAVAHYRDQWRRAAPRIGWGRGTQQLERILYESQVRGTSVNFAGRPTDFTVDRFGAPTMVRKISPEPVLTFPFGMITYGGDDVRLIERDSAGRVTKIVHAPDSAAIRDSVVYRYDALSHIERIIRPTAKFPVLAGDPTLDTVTFVYDSVTLQAGRAWCSRLLKMRGVTGPGDTTVVRYGTSGVARCLPERTIGTAPDTTVFTYGPLTPGDPAATRPVTVRDPAGLVSSMTYEPGTWNSSTHVRQSDGATSRAFYGAWGLPDSLLAPDGVRTFIQRDLSGRTLFQKTGSGPTAPTVATVYDPGDLVTRTDVYSSPDNALATQSTPPQSTRFYYDRLGQLDSTVSPGVRPAARKQAYVRDRWGNPITEYTGNGTFIGRSYDWQGRLSATYHHLVDPSRSTDGEPFADAATKAVYNSFGLTMGPSLSTGQRYWRKYDNRGREVAASGQDLFRGDSLYARRRAYSRTGALTADSLFFTDGLRIIRRYTYNRRGQRAEAVDTVKATAGSQPAEPAGKIVYTYDHAGRLESMDGSVGGTRYARARWEHDRASRVTEQGLLLGGATSELVTTRQYDAQGRPSLIRTQQAGAGQWYEFNTSGASYTLADRLVSYSFQETHGTSGIGSGTATLGYAADGTGRLASSARTQGATTGYTWLYDVHGNRTKENGSGTCATQDSTTYGADNRVVRRWSPSCPGAITRYWTDQAGNRLGESDSVATAREIRGEMSYTAANQLYYSFTPTAAQGTFDVNWHWYDVDGLRLVTHATGISLQNPVLSTPALHPDQSGGVRSYQFYDGADVALVVMKPAGGSWTVRQRFLSGGVDQPLAGRFNNLVSTKNLALVADRLGTTQVAVQANGTYEPNAVYYDRSPFGSYENASGSGGSTNTETGFTGASTPNQTGGFAYLRNRWYDPATGRFLTQDPIGLAGGLNLYAYAGNNPVMFSDPFGLCPESKRDRAGNCPGGLTVREWDAVEEGIAEVRHAGMRARLTRMLHGGQVKAAATLSDPAAAFGANIFDGSISGSRQFGDAGGSAFELPAEDIAFGLVHEIGHIDQTAGMSVSQKNSFQNNRKRDLQFADFIERGANTGACLLVPTTKLFAPACR